MNVFIFSNITGVLKSSFPETAVFLDPKALSEHSPSKGDMTYLDVTNLSETEIKKQLSLIKKVCHNKPWGIIDPKGIINDSSVLFFEGSFDYLGHGFFKGSPSVEPKRIKDAVQWKDKLSASAAKDIAATAVSGGDDFINTGIKLPSDRLFPGWKKMRSGQSMPFYLLHCSLKGKVPLDSRLNDKLMAQVHNSFLDCLEDNFYDGEGLLWMNTGKDCLFLVPPRVKCIEDVIKACMGMIVSAPLIVIETLGVSIPSNFVFVLHYGAINYKPPGKTGTVVSDAINYIFHLGNKKAEPGRLTISGELPEKTIPASLQDCFIPAGSFEDRKIWHTKKFNYLRPW